MIQYLGSIGIGNRFRLELRREPLQPQAANPNSILNLMCYPTSPLPSPVQHHNGPQNEVPHNRRAPDLHGHDRLLQNFHAPAPASSFEHAEVRSCWYAIPQQSQFTNWNAVLTSRLCSQAKSSIPRGEERWKGMSEDAGIRD